MTEEEASKRMCPVMVIVGALSNQTAKNVGIRCIASDCMLWVWDTEPTKWKLLDDEKQIYLPCEYAMGGRCALGGKQ